MGTLKGIDALHAIFMEDQKPFWRAYNGNSVKGRKIGEHMDKDSYDLEESWAKLEERLSRYDGGTFTVALLSKVGTNNNGANIHVVKLDGAVVSGTVTPSPGNVGTQLDHLIKLSEYLDGRSGDEIAGAYEGAKDEYKKDLEILKLKMELKQQKNGSALERFAAVCIPHILGHMSGQPAAILGTKGYDEEVDSDEDTTPHQPPIRASNNKLNLNLLFSQAIRLQKVLPDYNVNEVIIKLVNFVAKDPEAAKIFLNQI